MLKTRLLPAAVLPTLLAFLAQPLSASPVQVYTHDTARATYTDSSGELRGKHHGGQRAFLVELTRELMISLQLKPVMEEQPEQQALAQLDGPTPRALLDISRSDTDSDSYRWVGPLQHDRVYLYEDRRRKTDITSPADATGSSVCVRRGNGHDQLLEQQGFSRLVKVSSYKGCWDLLSSGEVSLATLNQTLVHSVLESDAQAAPVIQNTGVSVYNRDVWLAFSKSTPEQEIRRWQQALDQIQRSDIYQSLIHHYYCQQDCF